MPAASPAAAPRMLQDRTGPRGKASPTRRRLRVGRPSQRIVRVDHCGLKRL